MLIGAGLERLIDGTAMPVQDYEILRTRKRLSSRLLGLNVDNWGRIGNAVFADINAISAARHLGLEHVVLNQTNGFVSDKIAHWNGLTIYAARPLFKRRGCLLSGDFWEHLGGWPSATWWEQREIAAGVVRDFVEWGEAGSRASDPHELTAHIRGGDVFGKDVYADYTQPPLAFYKRAIADASAQHGVQRVRIVSEDNLNPCVDALKDFMTETGIPFVHQSASAIEDFATLARARHVAYGIGTFAHAACLISAHIKGVYTYNEGALANKTQFSWLDHFHPYYDKSETYIKVGAWSNNEAQRRQMVDHPDDAIAECAG